MSLPLVPRVAAGSGGSQSSIHAPLVENVSQPLGVELVSAHRTNKLSDPADLVDLAQAIQKADEFTKATVGGKLVLIADQIRHLQNQARKILEDAKRDTALHHAACNLVKKCGSVYYLYQRASGQSYLSLLSPQEWGSSCPHEFLGGYRLEYDQSWTPVADLAGRDQQNALVDEIFRLGPARITNCYGGASALTEIMDVSNSRGQLEES